MAFNFLSAIFRGGAPVVPTNEAAPSRSLGGHEGQRLHAPAIRLEDLADKSRLEIEAKRLIGKTRGAAISFDWKQFAMMQSASFVKGSSFDNGHSSFLCLNAYLSYLTILFKEGEFLKSGVSGAILGELIDALGVSRAIHQLWTSEEFEKGNQRFLSKITHELETKGYVYLIGGYRGGKNRSGHSITYKISLDRQTQRVTISFFNIGAGVGSHPELSATSTHIKVSYSYYPVVISRDLWDRMAPSFIAHLVQFRFVEPASAGWEYKTQNLYDLLSVFGAFSVEHIFEHKDKFAAIPQLIGDCAEKSVRNLVLDFLTAQKGIGQHNLNILFLNIHLVSIAAAYHSFLGTPQERHQILLMNACEESAKLLLRFKTILKPEGYLIAGKMIELILQSVQSRVIDPLVIEPPRNWVIPTDFPAISPPTVKTFHSLQMKSSPFSLVHIDIPTFNAVTFRRDFENILSRNKEKYTTFKTYLLAYITSLPLPHGQLVDAWDDIPDEDILPILSGILNFISYLHLRGGSGSRDSWAEHCTLYAIADKLVRKRSPFVKAFPHPHHELEPHLFFFSASDEMRYTQIREYFSCVKAACNGLMQPFVGGEEDVQILVKIAFTMAAAGFELRIDKTHSTVEDRVSNIKNNPYYPYRNTSVALVDTGSMRLELSREGELMYAIIRNWEELQNFLTTLKSKRRGDGISLDATFYGRGRDFNANRILCNHQNYSQGERTHADIKLSAELALLLCDRQLNFGLAVQWMRGRWSALNRVGVQDVMEAALFANGAFKAQLEETPGAYNELRTLIEEGIQYCGGRCDYTSATLFLIRLGIVLESYAANYQNRPINQRELKQYRVVLKQVFDGIQFPGKTAEEESLYLQAVAVESFLEAGIVQHTLDEFITIFANMVKLDLVYGGHFDSKQYQKTNHFRLFKQLQAFIEKEGERQAQAWNTFCNGVVSQLIPSDSKDRSWKRDPLTARFSCPEYIVDFYSGILWDTATYATLRVVDHNARKEMRYEGLGFKPETLWWWMDSQYVSLDRTTILSLSLDETIISNVKRDLVVSVLRMLPGQTSTSFAFFSNEDKKRLPFLQSFPLTFYSIEPVEQTQEPYILAYLNEGQTPFMRIYVKSTEVTVCRVDDRGNILPYLLVNLEKLETGDPLYSQTVHFAPAGQILCFVDPDSHAIQELYFHRLKLSFKRSQGRLMSQEFPGYYLASGTNLAALKGHEQHAMILRNDQKHIKVIIPPTPPENKRLGFAKGIEEIRKKKKLDKYYAYDLDSAASPFRFQKISAKLFLVYFFKMLGDYDAAIEELNKKDPPIMDPESWDVLQYCLSLYDQSPRSIAFNLRLILYMFDRFHEFPPSGNLFAVCGWYEYYLTAIGDDHISGIPIEWRLSEQEEQRICFVLEREIVTLPKMIKLRADLIHSTERAADVEFNSPAISLVPNTFQLILPPRRWRSLTNFVPKRNPLDRWEEYPNFVSKTYCESFFGELFEKARRVPQGAVCDPFDFTLLALLRSSSKDLSSLELASFLVFVRHFPEKFRNLSFEKLELSFSDINEMDRAFQGLKEDWAKKHQLPAISKMVVALPPSVASEPQPLPAPEKIDFVPKPFEPYLQRLFNFSTPSASSDHPSLFELHEDVTVLEREIVDTYTRAQARSAAPQPYTLRAESLDAVEHAIRLEEMQYQRDIKALQQSIVTRLNNPSDAFQREISLEKEMDFRLQLTAHQTYMMTPEMVMQEAILKNSTALFDVHRPMLGPDQVQKIIGDVHRYYHLLVLSSLCSEILALLKQLRAQTGNLLLEQELYHALSYEFQYAPELFPEIAYMRVKTGKLPRPEQLEVYRWVCEGIDNNENRLFQLSAGGGKTSYLIPLMILRSRRCKLIPFVLTTQAMYNIEKGNLKSTLHQLGIELATLEVGMHARMTKGLLEGIYQQLIVSVQERQAIITTPQTYYALRLGYFNLGEGQEEERVLLGKILGFLKRRALFLGDESHRNYDPMTQAIYGLGDFVTLREKEQHFLMTLAKPLFGMEQLAYRGGYLSEIVTSKEEGRGEASKEDLRGIRRLLAQHLFATCLKSISPEKRDEITRFLINKAEKEPACLNQLQAEERDLIYLGRYFFLLLLKQVLRMKTDFDHVHSVEQGGIDTPSYYKTPSHAQFKDDCLTFLLSIKGTWHRGLNRSQFAALIAWLQARDQEEKQIASEFDQTPSQQMFRSWTQEQFPLLTLESFNQTQFEAVYMRCSKMAVVVECYLTHFVLQTVGHSAEQLMSAPTHLMDSAKCSIIFSATPLPQFAYPQALKQTKRDDVFEAQVIARSASQDNQNFVFPADIADFFAQIAAQQAHYQQVRHMIDAGGFLCHAANRAVAQKWLNASNLDGVIYFKEEVSGYGEALCCRLREGTEIDFSSMSELNKTLIYHGLKNLKLGVFFDAAHAESAHFDPEPNTQAFILAGDALTLSHAIQAIMRERGFLNHAINQRIIWVVQKDLKEKMLGNRSEFSSQMIHTWCLRNEAKAERTRIMMAAYQDIAFRIEEHALSTNPSAYPAGLREEVSSHHQSGSQKKVEKTPAVLWQFARDYYSRFSFPEPLEHHHNLTQALEQTIEWASQKVPTLSVDFQATAACEMHQRCQVQQQIQIAQQVVGTDGMVFPALIKDHPIVSDPDYLVKMQAHGKPAGTIFNTDRMTRDFYLEQNQTLTDERAPMTKRFLKPIHFLLVVCQGKRTIAEAVSQDLLPRYVKALMEYPVESDIRHQAFLIRADGTLHRMGRGALAPTQEKITEVMSSSWMEDVLIDTALLNGTIPKGSRFRKRLIDWPDFIGTFGRILEAQAIQQEISKQTLLAYLS